MTPPIPSQGLDNPSSSYASDKLPITYGLPQGFIENRVVDMEIYYPLLFIPRPSKLVQRLYWSISNKNLNYNWYNFTTGQDKFVLKVSNSPNINLFYYLVRIHQQVKHWWSHFCTKHQLIYVCKQYTTISKYFTQLGNIIMIIPHHLTNILSTCELLPPGVYFFHSANSHETLFTIFSICVELNSL